MSVRIRRKAEERGVPVEVNSHIVSIANFNPYWLCDLKIPIGHYISACDPCTRDNLNVILFFGIDR